MKKPEDSQPKRPQRNKKGEEERRNGRPAQAPNRPVQEEIDCRATKWSGRGGDRRLAPRNLSARANFCRRVGGREGADWAGVTIAVQALAEGYQRSRETRR